MAFLLLLYDFMMAVHGLVLFQLIFLFLVIASPGCGCPVSRFLCMLFPFSLFYKICICFIYAIIICFVSVIHVFFFYYYSFFCMVFFLFIILYFSWFSVFCLLCFRVYFLFVICLIECIFIGFCIF